MVNTAPTHKEQKVKARAANAVAAHLEVLGTSTVGHVEHASELTSQTLTSNVSTSSEA